MAPRVVFFGNSQGVFSNRFFQAFVEAPCEIVGVVDVPPAGRTSTNTRTLDGTANFVEIAHQRGVPAFEPSNPNAPEFVGSVRELEPGLLAAVGYLFRLKDPVLSVPRLAPVNFHASLLPAYRGKHPVFWALRNGERWSGLTIHVMDSGLDTGDILYQAKVRTRKGDTVTSLYDRIMERGIGLVPRLVREAGQGRLRPHAQPESGVSYYSSVDIEGFRLDWSWPAERLRRLIQTSPGQCFCDVAGQRLFFVDAEVVADEDDVSPGVLVQLGRTGGTVKAGQDAVRLRRVKVGQTAEQPMPQVCRELGLHVGDCLAGNLPASAAIPENAD
jgi:methionyl-tRNA formyltransferase